MTTVVTVGSTVTAQLVDQLNANFTALDAAIDALQATPPGSGDLLSANNLSDLTDAETAVANLQFLQEGAGAVLRALRDKLRERASVKDFGAVGDGVADDRVALQAAFTWCCSGVRRSLWAPRGQYRCSGPLDATPQVAGAAFTLIGEDVNATELRFDFVRTLVDDACIRMGKRVGAYETGAFTLKNVNLRHASPSAACPKWLDIVQGGQHVIDNVRTGGCNGQAFRFSSVQNIRFNNLFMFGFGSIPVGKAFPFTDLTGVTFGVSGTTVTASSSIFTAAFNGRRLVLLDAGGLYHHFTLSSASGTTATVDVAAPLAGTTGFIETAHLTMSAASDVATLDSLTTVTDASDVGLRIWIADADSDHRMVKATVIAVPGANQWQLDYTSPSGFTNKFFGVPVVEFDQFPGGSRNVDAKCTNMHLKHWAGIGWAVEESAQWQIPSIKFETAIPPLPANPAVGFMWLDEYDGSVDGDLSGPHVSRSRIRCAGFIHASSFGFRSRSGVNEREFEVDDFSVHDTDGVGAVVVDYLIRTNRDETGDPPIAYDANAAPRVFVEGSFPSATGWRARYDGPVRIEANSTDAAITVTQDGAGPVLSLPDGSAAAPAILMTDVGIYSRVAGAFDIQTGGTGRFELLGTSIKMRLDAVLGFTPSNTGVAIDTALSRVGAGVMEVNNGTPGALGQLNASTVLAAAHTVTASNINAQTGTTYTIVAADNGKLIKCTNAAAIAVSLNTGLPAGFWCSIAQGGAGQVTLGGTATKSSANGLKTRAQHSVMTVSYYGATDTYVAAGDTAV